MKRATIAAVLVLLAGLLVFGWQKCNTMPSPSGPADGRYHCASGDTVRIAAVGPSQVQVIYNGTADSLRRSGGESGVIYSNASRSTVLWTKEGIVLLERYGQIRAHGCRTVTDSTQPTTATPSNARKSSLELDSWFRSPTGPNGYGYVLRYSRQLRIDQHRPHHTRFLYAGPNNEPPALTDGFAVHIGLVSTSPDTSLRKYARMQIKQSRRAGGKRLTPLRDTTVQGRSALVWTQESGLGHPVRHLAIGLGPETIATVSASTLGSQTQPYERIVRQMLSTLRFQQRPAPPATMEVSLAMLSDPGDSPERGCDDVVFVPHALPRTAAPLSAALDTLFAIEGDSVGGYRHFLSETNETLSLSHVSIDGTIARVYLEGHLSGLRGVCDNPRAKIQIEETVRRNAGVDSVAIYLDGERTELQPSGR